MKYLAHDKKDLSLCFTPIYKQENALTVTYNNVYSLTSKWLPIASNFPITNLVIIIMAETWLTKEPQTTFLLEDFDIIRMDSTIQPGHRGMIMFVKKKFHGSTMNSYQMPYVEICHCMLGLPRQKTSIIGIYKQPCAPYPNFWKNISQCLHQFLPSSSVLISDYNIKIHETQVAKFILDMNTVFNMQQIVQDFTTIAGTTIDLIFTNIPNVQVAAVANTWSTHFTLTANIPHKTV